MPGSAAVSAAKARRANSAGADAVRTEWFIKQVVESVNLTMEQRLNISMNYLRDRVVKNISIPVVKQKSERTGRIVVTERSKPGEFPRADTTLLMKSIFAEVRKDGNSMDGYVGTPVGYSIGLELNLNRRFLTRTLNEELNTIKRMMLMPIDDSGSGHKEAFYR